MWGSEALADAESRELQHERPEMRGERGYVPAEVSPAGDSRARSVEKNQRRAVAGLAVAQNTVFG